MIPNLAFLFGKDSDAADWLVSKANSETDCAASDAHLGIAYQLLATVRREEEEQTETKKDEKETTCISILLYPKMEEKIHSYFLFW